MARTIAVNETPAILEISDPTRTFENACNLVGGTYEEEKGWFRERRNICEVEDDEDFVALSIILKNMLPKLPKNQTFEVKYKYFYDKRGEFSVFNEDSKLNMTGELEGESSLTDEMMWSSIYDQINEERSKRGLRELEEDVIHDKVGHIIDMGVNRGFDAVRDTPEQIEKELKEQKEIGKIKPYLVMGDKLDCDVKEYDGTTYPICSIEAIDVTLSPIMRVLDDMEDTLDASLEKCSDNFYAELNKAIDEAVEELPA